MPSSRAVAAAVAVALGTLLLLSLASPAQAKGSFAHARARRSLAQLEEAGGAGDLASQANETTEEVTRNAIESDPYPSETPPPSLDPVGGADLAVGMTNATAGDEVPAMDAVNGTSTANLTAALEDPRNATGGGGAGNDTADGACPPTGFDSIKDFNLSAWTEHPWYIQEQMPVVYQRPPFFCVRASYEQTGENEVRVMNTAKIGSVEGTEQNPDAQDFPLKAVIDDLSDPSKLKVGPEFLPPELYGPYWVVFAGPTQDNYEYGIVSGGPPTIAGEDGCIAGTEAQTNGAGLWLFAKDPQPEEGTVQMLKDKATELGFDLSVLQPVTHEGCTYPGDQD